MSLPTPPETMNKELYKLNMAEERLTTKVNQLISFSHELVEYLKDEKKVQNDKFFEEMEDRRIKDQAFVDRCVDYANRPSPEAPQEKECIHWDCTRRLDWTCKVCYPTPQEKEYEHRNKTFIKNNGDLCGDCGKVFCVCFPTPESEVDVHLLLEEYAIQSATWAQMSREESFKRMSEIEEILSSKINRKVENITFDSGYGNTTSTKI